MADGLMDGLDGKRQAELRQWDVPWYRAFPHWMAERLYTNPGPQQGADMQKLFGTQNPFNLPGNAAEGASRLRSGWDRGDIGEMIGGGLQAAGAIAPVAGAAGVAGRLGPSARSILRENRAWESNTPAARGQAERTGQSGSRQFDSLASGVDKDTLRKASERHGGMDNLRRDFERSLSPIDWLVHKTGGNFWGGQPSKLKTFFSPGHLAAQGAGLAGMDHLFGLGIMPWSWNDPGTLQRQIRDDIAEEGPKIDAKGWASNRGMTGPPMLSDSPTMSAVKRGVGRGYEDIAERATGRKIGYDPQLPFGLLP